MNRFHLFFATLLLPMIAQASSNFLPAGTTVQFLRAFSNKSCTYEKLEVGYNDSMTTEELKSGLHLDNREMSVRKGIYYGKIFLYKDENRLPQTSCHLMAHESEFHCEIAPVLSLNKNAFGIRMGKTCEVDESTMSYMGSVISFKDCPQFEIQCEFEMDYGISKGLLNRQGVAEFNAHSAKAYRDALDSALSGFLTIQ